MKPKSSIIFPQLSAEPAEYLAMTTLLEEGTKSQRSPTFPKALKAALNTCCGGYHM